MKHRSGEHRGLCFGKRRPLAQHSLLSTDVVSRKSDGSSKRNSDAMIKGLPTLNTQLSSLTRFLSLPCNVVSWFDKSLAGSGIALLPITPAIATSAVHLHEHHSDPQDRIIIATALAHGAKLMSDDGKFSKYAELKGSLL